MKIHLSVEVADADVNLDHYKEQGEEVTLIDAIESDLELYRAGEIGLEEVIYNYGGEVDISLIGVTVDGSTFKLKELNGILSNEELIQTKENK